MLHKNNLNDGLLTLTETRTGPFSAPVYCYGCHGQLLWLCSGDIYNIYRKREYQNLNLETIGDHWFTVDWIG